MKKLLLTMTGVLLALPAFAQEFQYEYEGQTLWYTVLSEDDKTVQTAPGRLSGNFMFSGNEVSGNLIIPAIAKDGDVEYTVTSISDYAFTECSGLTSVTIPNSVTSIGYLAFGWCEGLTSVIIGNSVTSISSVAFQGCKNLIKVAYPEHLDNPFSHYRARIDYPQSAIIEDGFIWEQDRSAIYFAPLNLEGEYIIPNSVKFIEGCAFVGCNCLTSVTIPNSVNSIGQYAFGECSGLTSVTIPESVTSIGEGAFWSCSGLTSVTIPNSINSIGSETFYKCSGLTMVTMGGNVETVGADAFNGSNNIKKVKTDNINKWARINFENSEANPLSVSGASLFVGEESELASSVVIEGSEPVGSYAFSGARFLEKVRVKDGAPVGEGSFTRCPNLKQVCLNTPSMESKAFSDCGAIETVYSTTTTPPTAPDDAFSVYDKANLYVPNKCVSAYESASTCWYRFVNVSSKDMTDLDEIFAPSYSNDIPVSEIILNESTLTLEVGKTFSLSAEIKPADATNTAVDWTSSNGNCVSVDENGLVTAIAEGEATITVRSADGNAEATCSVTVIPAKSGIVEIEADCGNIEVFDIRGIKVGTSTKGLPLGVYIVRQGCKTTKIVVK